MLRKLIILFLMMIFNDEKVDMELDKKIRIFNVEEVDDCILDDDDIMMIKLMWR